MKNKKAVFWAFWTISVVLFFARVPAAAPSGGGMDKLAHIVIFAALTYTGLRAYRRTTLVVTLLAAYTIAVEILQIQLFPYRSFELLDIASGLVGIVFATISLITSPQPSPNSPTLFSSPGLGRVPEGRERSNHGTPHPAYRPPSPSRGEGKDEEIIPGEGERVR